MKAHKTILEPVRPQASGAMIFGTSAPRSSAVPDKAPQTAKPAHSIPQALRQEAAKVREDIRRHYETHFETSWHHGGINE